MTINVYSVNTEKITEQNIASVKDKLFSRFAEAEKYRSHENFLRSVGAGLLLIYAYPEISDGDIQKGEYGKPYLTTDFAEKYFNISHSGKYVVLAKSDVEVGIDIEELNEKKTGVAKRCFTVPEQKWMDANPAERFFFIWTAKESVMKITGRGFSLSPKSFTVFPFSENKSISIDDMTIYCRSVQYDGYYLSVALQKRFDGIEIYEII